MPTPTRPSTYPDWALTGTRTDPGGAAINTGYAPNFRPPAEWHNWQFGFIGDWVRWLDYITQISSANIDYDAYVGSGLSGSNSFADFNALMAYGGIAGIKKVLVKNPMTVTTTQIINAAGIEFVMHPSAVISKGGATTPGISIQANGTTFSGAGRFTDFSGGSDKAIQIEAGIKNCRISGQRFNNDTVSINDLGTNNVLSDNIEET